MSLSVPGNVQGPCLGSDLLGNLQLLGPLNVKTLTFVGSTVRESGSSKCDLAMEEARKDSLWREMPLSWASKQTFHSFFVLCVFEIGLALSTFLMTAQQKHWGHGSSNKSACLEILRP
jgi:hypothetical protein